MCNESWSGAACTHGIFAHPLTTTDPNGVKTQTTYDALGRLATTTTKAVAGCDTGADPLCATDLVRQTTYQLTVGPTQSSILPAGGTTAYGYDSRSRVVSVSRGPSASDLRERIDYTYDASTGQQNLERMSAYESGSWVEKRRESYAYDSRGRLALVTHPDATSVAYAYDGANNISSVRDERHTAANTTYAYDPMNRLASVKQALSTAPGGQIATSYAYDIHGDLTSVTDPNGNVTAYVYDDFGRMLSQTSPVTGTTSYSYDSAGNLTASTDANGVTTTRVYDALNRITAATATGATSEATTWTYDGTAPFANGRLTSMTDPTGATSYSYERRGLLTTAADNDGITTSFAYDADGNRTRLGYPSGRVVQTTFDFAGRPVAASSDGTAIVNSASYLPFGPMTSLAYGNGTTKTMLYDSRYRSQENMLSTSTSVIADYLYQEDAVGNITQIHDATNAAYNRDFGYDDLNRLTTANTGSSLWGTGGYQYDAMGNMTSLHVGSRSLSFAYAGTTPRIQSVSGTNPETVTYDNAGNEVSAGRYSPRNLLEGIGNGDPRMEPGLALGYSYDGRGVRIVTSLTTPGMPPWGGTKTRRSVYSPELHLLSQSAWSGEDVELGEGAGRSSSLATRTRSPRAALTLAAIRPTTVIPIGGSSVGTDYIWFADQPVAQAFTDPSQPVRYTFTDHLGTPILQTDATAAVIWRVEYEPYGSIYSYRAGDANDPQALRLPGQEAPESLNTAGYNIFRWYRAEWGRYTQADPIGLVPTLFGIKNLFGYADTNPVDHADRLGLYSIDKGCSDSCGPDNVTSCYGNPQRINCAKGLVNEVKQRVFFNAPCKKALQAAEKWQQVAGSLMPSAPYPRLTCNKADCTGSEPRYFPATRSIPMCKWFFAYSPPAGAQSMLHEFLHDAGVGDGTPEQTSILTACYPGFAP